MKVLVCGSRRWADVARIVADLEKLPSGTVVVEGDAPGADRIAGQVAEELGLVVRRYPADWGKLGPAAGPVRNQRMLDEEHPDADGAFFNMAFAYHDDPGLGSGTRDMVRRLKRARIPVIVRLERPWP